MTVIYSKKTIQDWDYIERINEDKSVSVIPIDEANSDYQAYLEHEAKAK